MVDFVPEKAYKKGCTPWNKGTKGICKPNCGSFQKGNVSKIKGKKCPEISKRQMGKDNPNYGHKLTIEERRIKSLNQRGSKSGGWKGGLTKKHILIRCGIETRLWREAVFARDNWTCQKCKVKGCNINAHHIKNFAQYPELRFAIDNGVVLCQDCHREFHKIYGRKNNNKEQIDKFITGGN